MERYKDKIAIVTGGASGIGRALCAGLAELGATVIIADIDAAEAGRTVKQILKSGGKARSALLDVSDESKVFKTVEKAAVEFGRLDYMFNNAGICISGDARDITMAQWRKMIDVNLYGVVYGTLAAYSVMASQGFGHIINISSMAGFAPFAINTPYTTAKYAIVGFTDSLRAEAHDMAVRISLVCPGIVRTGFYDSMDIVNADRDKYKSRLPSRIISAEKAAHIILRKVAKNKKMILFPLHAHIFWWIKKLAPAVIDRLNLRMVRTFRAIRR
jgi:NAD(P)-dependent dehydrogenase (short-subunit alcohol dehydrogenase family)